MAQGRHLVAAPTVVGGEVVDHDHLTGGETVQARLLVVAVLDLDDLAGASVAAGHVLIRPTSFSLSSTARKGYGG